MGKTENVIFNDEIVNRVLAAAKEITGIDYYKKDGQLMLDSVILAIEQTLSSGEGVYIKGFGQFNVRMTKPRQIISPRGITYDVSPVQIVKFKPGKRLKREVAQGIIRPVECDG